MNIAISGATGFIGKHLSDFLSTQGHKIISLSREVLQSQNLLNQNLNGCDVVINLAGAPISLRWNTEYKKEMYRSRIDVTRKIVTTINGLKNKPKLFISTSAVGYYPNKGCYDEYNDMRGSGFLSDLCKQWEKEASKVSQDVRLVITRFGIVLSPDGGMLKKTEHIFKLKFAGIAGKGTQYFPWIDLNDLMQIMVFIIKNQNLKGTFNLVAPQIINNKKFTKSLAPYFGSWITVKIPSLFFQIFIGEASSFILKGQCVRPTRLLNAGYQFQTKNIDQYFQNLKSVYK